MTKFGTLALENGRLVEKHTMELDLNNLPSSDPIAFGYGIHSGQRCLKEKIQAMDVKHGSKHSELAQEYLRGFLLGYKGILVPEGTKIKKGYERCYALLDKNILKK